jgi:methylated-DNA-[protein]-cysteine S-methyltransferase
MLTQELFYCIFSTAAGWVGALASEMGLSRVTLPRPSASEAEEQLGDSINQAVNSPELFQDLTKRLGAYYDGHRVDFPDKLDFSTATAFQREVWSATRLIPYGQTRSYTWVAGQIGRPKAVRAVGQALSRNPLPVIVPCHRVLAIDGTVGGFSGGLEMKRFLLHLEGSSAV